ncbi:MAG: hypothetical protein QMD53_00465 [Actinomycetota bacterium]|nr:hypothetical protein [Actinomycetota bacterium]
MTKNSNSESEIKKLKDQLEMDELELKIVEAERKIAESRKEIFESKLPKIAGAPSKDRVSVEDKYRLESRILSYKAIAEIASQIALEVGRIGSERVMIYSESHLEMVTSYRSFLTQINLLIGEYETALRVEDEAIAKIMGRKHDGHIDVKEYAHKAAEEEAADSRLLTSMAAKAVISTVAPIAMKSFMDIASLFKNDTGITFSEFNLVEEALVAEVANHLKYDGVEVVYPSVISRPPELILTALFDLRTLKDRAIERLNELKGKDSNKGLAERLKVLNAYHDRIISILNDKKDEDSQTVFEGLMKAEGISFELDKEGTDMLALKPVYVGGNSRLKRSVLKSSASHMGGAIITYILSSPDGIVRSSKTLYNYTGYKRFRNPKKRGVELNNFEVQSDKKKGLKLNMGKDDDFI